MTKTFIRGEREITPLENLSLTVAAGEFVTIQGPTGGGKSTLLQIVGALDRATSGRVECDGIDLSAASTSDLTRFRASAIGFVFQSFNLLATLTAAENVNVALEGGGMTQGERALGVEAALSRVGLADRATHRPAELSGGQQQRVAIARAIVSHPTLLLADELTGNLDEAMREEILDLLSTLNDEGLTIIAVTHDSAVAARAHRRLVLSRGSLHTS